MKKLIPVSNYPLMRDASSIQELFMACDIYGLRRPEIDDYELRYLEMTSDTTSFLMYMFDYIAKFNGIDLELYREP